jgi:hypothetical protein
MMSRKEEDNLFRYYGFSGGSAGPSAGKRAGRGRARGAGRTMLHKYAGRPPV